MNDPRTATRCRALLVALFLAGAALPAPAASGGSMVSDTTLVIVREVAIDPSFHYTAARQRALEEAMAEATRVYGLFVESSQGLLSRDSDGEVAQTYWAVVAGDAVGVVTDYSLLSEGAYQEGGRSWYRFTFRIRVERQAASAGDPGYAVLVSLNRDTFIDRGGPGSGEEMIVTVEPTRDSYLAILYQRDDSLWVLYPNPVAGPELVEAGTPFEYPSLDLRRAGLHLRLSAPEGRTESHESILVVATRERIEFGCGRQVFASYEIASGGCSLRDLGRWRLSVPRDRRALGAHPYRIQRTF